MSEPPKRVIVYITETWPPKIYDNDPDVVSDEESSTWESTEAKLGGEIRPKAKKIYFLMDEGIPVPIVTAEQFAFVHAFNTMPLTTFLLQLERVANPKGSFVYKSNLYIAINANARVQSTDGVIRLGRFEPWEAERLKREAIIVSALARDEDFLDLLSPRARELFTEILAYTGNVKSDIVLAELAKDTRLQTSALKLARASHEMSARKYLTGPQMRGLDETMRVHRNVLAHYFAKRK